MASARHNGFGLKKQFSKVCSHVHYKVILLGDYGVGKTSLFARIKAGDQHDPSESSLSTSRSSSTQSDTIDHCVRTFVLESGKKVQVRAVVYMQHYFADKLLHVLP